MSISAFVLAFLLQPSPAYVVGGTVVDAITNQPLAKVSVRLARSGARDSAVKQTTGGDGKFRFEGLPAGKYTLSASRLRYVTQAYGQRALYAGFSTAIVTGPEEQTGAILFRMIPSGTITGVARDQFGEGIPGMDIVVYRQTGADAQKRLLPMGRDTTNDLGEFRVHSLPAGNLLVAVSGKPWQQGDGQTTDDERMGYAPTFHPSARAADKATLVRVDPGRETTADISVTSVPVVSVLGRFLGRRDGGEQLAAYLSTPLMHGAEIWVGRGSTVNGATFLLLDVPRGEYTLNVIASSRRVVARKQVTISGDHPEVSIGDAPAARVVVKVAFQGESKESQETIVFLRDVEGKFGEPRVLDRDGTATFPSLVRGRYQLSLTRKSGQPAIVSVAAKGAPARAGIVDIPETGEVELTVVADGSAALLNGRVFKGGRPQPGVAVVLAPLKEWENLMMYRFDQSDSDGTFKWSGVPPGEYMAFAFESGEVIDHMDPEALRKYITQGEIVTVGPEKIQSVRLELPANGAAGGGAPAR